MYWLFDTGVAANSKLHTRPARKWKDCCSSVIAILVGLPSAAESVAGKTSSAIAEPLAASSKKQLESLHSCLLLWSCRKTPVGGHPSLPSPAFAAKAVTFSRSGQPDSPGRLSEALTEGETAVGCASVQECPLTTRTGH